MSDLRRGKPRRIRQRVGMVNLRRAADNAVYVSARINDWEQQVRADERERAAYAGPCWDGCIHNEAHLAALESRDHEIAHAEQVAAQLVEVICRLHRWKREALTVLAEWDEVHTALGSPGRLGESKAGAARAEATRLRAEVRHIARTVMALPVLSWAHTDDCPGRPGMRGICACAMVPLVSRDAVLAAVAPTPAEWCEWAGWEGLL